MSYIIVEVSGCTAHIIVYCPLSMEQQPPRKVLKDPFQTILAQTLH